MRHLSNFVALLLLALIACSKPKAREACKTEGAVRCLDEKDALYCIGGKWELAACNGAQGCKGSGDDATCANDVHGLADPCADEGATGCSLDNKALLRCEDKHWFKASDCRGPRGCVANAKGAACE